MYIIGDSLKTLAIAPALAAGVSAIGGCNTTAGFGEDVEAAGQAIEREAEEEQRD